MIIKHLLFHNVLRIIDEPSSGKRSPDSSSLCPTMLTALSTQGSTSSIDMSGPASINLTPAPSPPTSGMTTPTHEQMLVKRRASQEKTTKSRSRSGSQSSENPLLGTVSRGNSGKVGDSACSSPVSYKSPTPGLGVVGGVSLGGGGMVPTIGSFASHMAGQVKLSGAQGPSLPKPPHPTGSSVPPPQSTGALEGAPLQQQQLVGMGVGIRSLNQPTVVASPLKVPVSQLPHAVQHNLSSWALTRGSAKTGDIGKLGVAGGEAGKEERVEKPRAAPSGGEGSSGEGGDLSAEALPPKRMRFTRKAAGNLGNVDD